MRLQSYNIIAVFVVLALLVGASGCAPKRYEFPPVTVQSDAAAPPVPSGGELPDLPPNQLFAKGYAAFEAGDREGALRYFTALVERHPQAPEFADGAYNAGLLLQRLDRHEEAVTRFEQVVSANLHPQDVVDARFRLLASFHELGRWSDSLVQVEALERRSLPLDDALEVRMRRGVALFHLGQPDEAHAVLESTFTDYQIGLRRDQVINEIPGTMSAYYLGMIHRGRFDAAPLTLADAERMRAQMEQRAQHLQDAQDWFLKCIQQDNVTWATASGLQIGSLYRDFYTAIHEVSVPPELVEDDEIRLYRCMLFEQVKVLLRKAMRVYEHTLDIGLRLRVRNRFTEQTRQDLSEVENLYLGEERACEDVLPAPSTPAGRLP